MPGEYPTLLLGAQVVRGNGPRRLLLLSALPPPPRELSVVRPERFRLDGDLRLPPERDPAAVPLPSPVRSRQPPRPRTPLARAPLSRVDPRAFRLDPRALTLANEDGVPVEPVRIPQTWLRADFRRDTVDERWMAKRRIWGLAPFQVEWFTWWWEQHKAEHAATGDPLDYEPPEELADLMQHNKEQMLIRRDVPKDEQPPEAARFERPEAAPPIAAHTRPDIVELIPPTPWLGGPLPRAEWIEIGPQRAEAYLQWRTLMDALGD